MDEGQEVELTGVPVEITVRVGPGVLVPGGPVGEQAIIFIQGGCLHSIILAAITHVQTAVALAYKRASDSVGGEGEGGEGDASGTIRFDA